MSGTATPATNADHRSRLLDALTLALTGQAYADVTIADIVAVVGLDFARLVRYRPPAEFENLARWLEACRARPAAKAGAWRMAVPRGRSVPTWWPSRSLTVTR